MRDTKFRGIRVDNDELVYGYYVKASGKHYILTNEDHRVYCGEVFSTESFFEVLPETVGQWTGLKDKNEKEIYEGDILKTSNAVGKIYSSIVTWKTDEGKFIGSPSYGTDYYMKGFMVRQCHLFYACEVIGNIHETPELFTNTVQDKV